jgi:predicted RNase H-like nuclease (RuvC/YqgF family)
MEVHIMPATVDSSKDERLTLSQAAKLVGKASTTLRRLVDLGALSTIRDETGKHWVRQSDVISHYAVQAHTVASRPSTGDKTQRSGATTAASHSHDLAVASEVARLTATVSGQQTQISLLHDSLARERQNVEGLKKQVENLEQERTQHLAEMRALLSGKSEGLLSLKKWFGK